MLYEDDFADFLLFIPYILLEYGADYMADLAVYTLQRSHIRRTSIGHRSNTRLEIDSNMLNHAHSLNISKQFREIKTNQKA